MLQGDRDQDQWSGEESVTHSRSSSLLVGAVAVVLVAGGATAGYAIHEQSAAKDLATHNAEMSATVMQLRNQLDAMTTKLNEMSAAQSQAAQTQPAAPPEGARPAKARRTGPSVSDKRYKQLQARLDAQQKELKDTEDSVTKARADLESSLSSAKDELNGTIAKNHDELVALEKRGERSYFEFDLTKSKQFQRTGPISISLRRTDTKHMNYDAVVLVDDNQLTKKHVDLYEPVYFDRADDPQPLQVVVNKMDRNHVHGYVSTPRYRNSELAANNTSVAPRQNGAGSPAANSSGNSGAQPPAAPQDQIQNAPLQQQ